MSSKNSFSAWKEKMKIIIKKLIICVRLLVLSMKSLMR